MSKNIYLLAACFLLSIPLAAQSTWSAEGPGLSVWVGASMSTFNPDYGCKSDSPVACWDHQLLGISPVVGTNSFLFNRIGAEGQARFLHWRGPGNLTESSYMAGPRVSLWSARKLRLSGRFMVGTAHLDLSSDPARTGTYLAFAPGPTLDYRISRRLFTRIDYEYQIWPGFKGSSAGHTGLTPNGLSIGVNYALTR